MNNKKYWILVTICAFLFITSCVPTVKEALKLYQNGNEEEALNLLLKIVNENPADDEAHLLIAKINENQKNFKKAIYHYRKCIDLNPNQKETMLKLGNLLIMTEKYVDGTKILEKIKDEIQQDKITLNNFGRGLLYMGRFEESQKVLQKLLRMSPDYPEVYLNLGILAYKMRNYEIAQQRLLKGLELDETNAKTHFWLAQTYGKKGLNKKMEFELQESISIDPKFEKPYIYLGKFLIEKNRFGEAAEVFNELVYYVPFSKEGKNFLLKVKDKLNWPVKRRNNARTCGLGPSVEPPCRIKWEAWVGKDLKWSPITIGSLIVIVDGDRLVSLEPKTGKQKWVRPLDSKIVKEPIVALPYVYVCEKSVLTAVTIKNSSIIWQYKLNGTISVSPMQYKGSILVLKKIQKSGSGGIVLDFIDREKGKLLSSFPLYPNPRTNVIFAAVEEDYLYTVLNMGKVGKIISYDLFSGEKVWEYSIPGCKIEPCISETTLFLAPTRKNIVAIDLENGEKLWEKSLNGNLVSGLMYLDYALYGVYGKNGRLVLFRIDNDSGEIEWETEQKSKLFDKINSSFISITGKTIVWCLPSGKIIIIDTDSGNISWNYIVPSLPVSAASILDGRFVLNSKKGFVFAFEHGVPISESQQEKAARQIGKKIKLGKKELAKQVRHKLLAFSLVLQMVVNSTGEWTGGFDVIIKNDNDYPLTNVQVILDGKYIYTSNQDSKARSMKFIDIGKTWVVNTLQFKSLKGEPYPTQGKPMTIKILADQGQGFTKISWNK